MICNDSCGGAPFSSEAGEARPDESVRTGAGAEVHKKPALCVEPALGIDGLTTSKTAIFNKICPVFYDVKLFNIYSLCNTILWYYRFAACR